jgi:hypothetical protein
MYPQGMVRQALIRLGVLVTLAVLALSACGEGSKAHGTLTTHKGGIIREGVEADQIRTIEHKRLRDATLSWAGVIGFAVPALAIVAATRGRLGYRPELLDDEPERELGGVTAAPGGTGGVTADHKVIWMEKSRPGKLVPIFWHPHRPLQLETGEGGRARRTE